VQREQTVRGNTLQGCLAKLTKDRPWMTSQSMHVQKGEKKVRQTGARGRRRGWKSRLRAGKMEGKCWEVDNSRPRDRRGDDILHTKEIDTPRAGWDQARLRTEKSDPFLTGNQCGLLWQRFEKRTQTLTERLTRGEPGSRWA